MGMGLGMGTNSWEWEGIGMLQPIPAHLYYKRPAGEYPLCDFHEICSVCSSFENALTLKFGWTCYGVMGF